MSSVVLTATLLCALGLALPGRALAQDPPPPPAPPQNVAVPRSERITTRDTEARAPQNTEERRTSPRAEQPAPVREPATAGESGSRRRENANAEEGSRRRERVNAPIVNASDDEQGSGGDRRGAVRRPPSSGGPGGSGQASGDRAVPRGDAPRRTERVFVYPDYYRRYNRYYDPWGYGGFGLGYFYYSPWGWNPSYYGYGNGYGNGYGGPGYGGPGYGYAGQGYGRYDYDMGTVKLKVKPRDAEVYVDGYYAGTVDDFDGLMQALRLDSGGYRIEIRKPGFETLLFDVRVQAERSITFRGDMKPVP